ncbi:MAG: SDR family oxidoreductase [Rubrivivax sp.]|nr:SDR family oxidoreductase [Burkholderiales bacterium]MCW5637063.1 SDR family oxidoreductase [Rubrivivax sp.]
MNGKIALVTGGSRGIGLAIARTLAQRGAQVTVTGRDPAHGEEGLASLRAIDPRAAFEAGEAGDHASMSAIVERTVKRCGGLDILVSAGAAGPVGPTPFAEMTAEQIQASVNARLYPRIFPIHAALPALRARGAGSVIMITTDAARHPTPGEAVIGAVGAAIVLMTKGLAREFSRWNIRVNGVALTLTSETPGWDRIFSKPGFENRLFSKALQRFPQGRAPKADEVAEVAAFLASDAASQVNGQTVSVNGGLSFGGW